MIVLSPDLKVLNTYTADDITALSPSGVQFNGSSAVTHLVDGRIVIGNVEAAPRPEVCSSWTSWPRRQIRSTCS